MKERPVLVWFRQDLRLQDNPALQAAAAGDRPVAPVYVWSPE
ncbi:MAG: deoxyribodipyrimidine photo-lyase, partial [Candidatus Latescibacteria bacterium]|nr:deoxyribodipyrimidine photo-lyase [Candidatus Latescibacterota bacterium]